MHACLGQVSFSARLARNIQQDVFCLTVKTNRPFFREALDWRRIDVPARSTSCASHCMHVVARLTDSLHRSILHRCLPPPPNPRVTFPSVPEAPKAVYDRRSRFGTHARLPARTRRPSDVCPYRDGCSRYFSGVVRCPVLVGGCDSTRVRWLVVWALGPRGLYPRSLYYWYVSAWVLWWLAWRSVCDCIGYDDGDGASSGGKQVG